MNYRTIKPLYTVMDSLQRKKAIDDFYATVSEDASPHELSTKIAELKLYSEDLFSPDGLIIQPDRIDPNITDIIKSLNDHGIITRKSCEGHSKYEQLGGSGAYILFGRIKNKDLFNKLERELLKKNLIVRKVTGWISSADIIDNWNWSYRGEKERYWDKFRDVITPIIEDDKDYPKKKRNLIDKLLGR